MTNIFIELEFKSMDKNKR